MTSDHFRKHTTRIIAARPCCDSCSFLRRVGRLWKRLSSNARLISPPRAAESRWGLSGQLVHLVWWSSRQRGRNRRGTERILILTKLTHLGLRSGSRSLVPLCETVKNEQLFAHREGPYLALFSPSCHLPWNENLSIKTEKSVLENDAPVHPAAWSVAVCIKVRRWCLSLSSWKSRTQTTSFSERWLEGILGT